MRVATLVQLTFTAFMITAAASQTPSTVYTNHTVGEKAGWFFNSTASTPAVNYSSWAASQTFNLGDFLIFNTNTNQTVIQTYNETTFRNCTIDESLDNDTIQYDGGNTAFGIALTISVPLTIEGPNYFFSDGEDGNQCLHGMAFEIQVNRGLGLPPSLNQPPPPPYREPDSAQSPPIPIQGGPQSSGNLRVKDLTGAGGVACGLLFIIAGCALF
ncbi:copper ion binding protein, putative [Ricinus communis]|uniref:Copper ion binding protein, putative n=1 Tax=Ricinus communis TaxID=3988 RepID=B9RDG0_RICCO|nr:copper ion binding protein, putative [Ricinus communis]|eukprot:XP_002511749.1 cucumber peeling cupredoxin [Ricinus communis]